MKNVLSCSDQNFSWTLLRVKPLSVDYLIYFQGKVVVHSIPPYAMAWTNQHIAVAGPDKKVVFYTMDGMMAQQFDYFR